MLKLNPFTSPHHCCTHFLSRIATNWWVAADRGVKQAQMNRERLRQEYNRHCIPSANIAEGKSLWHQQLMLGLDVTGWFRWYIRGGRWIQRCISWQQCTGFTSGSKSLDQLQSNERKHFSKFNYFWLILILILILNLSLAALLGISDDRVSTWKLTSHAESSFIRGIFYTKWPSKYHFIICQW